jgi:hypothetical protein
MGLSYTDGGMACGVERGWSEWADFCRGLVVHGGKAACGVATLTAALHPALLEIETLRVELSFSYRTMLRRTEAVTALSDLTLNAQVERAADGRSFMAMLGPHLSQRYPGYSATYCAISTHSLPLSEITMSSSLFMAFEEEPVRPTPQACKPIAGSSSTSQSPCTGSMYERVLRFLQTLPKASKGFKGRFA